MWGELQNWMTSNRWDLAQYWAFIYKEFPPEVKRHDMTCVANLARRSEEFPPDALGPRVMFLTVDSKLRRLRRHYSFITSPEQFLEFILPYSFLSDIPIVDAERFPNQLLAAQLGTLLVKRPPEGAEIIRAYFNNPTLASKDAKETFSDLSENLAKALNADRFKRLVRESEDLDDAARQEPA